MHREKWLFQQWVLGPQKDEWPLPLATSTNQKQFMEFIVKASDAEAPLQIISRGEVYRVFLLLLHLPLSLAHKGKPPKSIFPEDRRNIYDPIWPF